MERLPYEVCKTCKDWKGNITKCFNECGKPLDAIEELRKYKQLQDMIGIPFEKFAELCKEAIPDECKNPRKTIILTDESVDEWQQYKTDKEQGLLHRFPCKVGDTIWVVYANGDISKQKVEYISKNIHSKDWNIGFHIGQIPISNFGKTAFHTEIEAEQVSAKIKAK